MRRAISCVYCAPKSRMRMRSAWMSSLWMSVMCFFGNSKRRRETRVSLLWSASAHPVIRRLFGDLHVVHVAFALPCASHLHERRLFTHVFDRRAADITHRRAQAAGELVHHAAQRAAIRDASFEAFRHQLVGVAGILEITIFRTLFHCAEAAHASIALVAATLEQLDLPRRFLGAGEQSADHHRRCTGDDRLAD